jgi:hypothetical protein
MIQDILPQGDDPAGAMLESIKGNTIHYGERVIIMAVAVETPDDAPKVKTVKFPSEKGVEPDRARKRHIGGHQV